jgi:hypothetical protein
MSLNHPLLSLLSTNLSEAELKQLVENSSTFAQRCPLFGNEKGEVLIYQQLQLFRAAFPAFQAFCQQQFQEMTDTHV